MSARLLPFRRTGGAGGELSDEALLFACASGDAAALAALFERLHHGVHRFLTRLLGGEGREVEDLVQATFVEAWRMASGFKGKSAARTWVLGIAANLARHHVRAEARRRASLQLMGAVPRAADALPDATAERRQLVERLGAALAGLPLELREVFVLCDIEGVAGVEAARALGLRDGTLYRRLHEARQALRVALGDPR